MNDLQAGRPSAGAPGAAPAVFYRYTDAQGRLHIVDSLSEVPAPLRSGAERVELSRAAAPPDPVITLPSRVDWPSFAVGFASACVFGGLLLLFRRRFGLVAKLGFGVAAVALLGALYLGLLRRATGQSGALTSSPQALIEDARRAADGAKQRQQRQEELLRQIEREAK